MWKVGKIDSRKLWWVVAAAAAAKSTCSLTFSRWIKVRMTKKERINIFSLEIQTGWMCSSWCIAYHTSHRGWNYINKNIKLVVNSLTSIPVLKTLDLRFEDENSFYKIWQYRRSSLYAVFLSAILCICEWKLAFFKVPIPYFIVIRGLFICEIVFMQA